MNDLPQHLIFFSFVTPKKCCTRLFVPQSARCVYRASPLRAVSITTALNMNASSPVCLAFLSDSFSKICRLLSTFQWERVFSPCCSLSFPCLPFPSWEITPSPVPPFPRAPLAPRLTTRVARFALFISITLLRFPAVAKNKCFNSPLSP